MSITRLSLRGFKSIHEIVAMELRGMNILIGANGAGKTNLTGFFRMLSSMVAGSLQEFVGRSGGAASMLRNGPKCTQSIEAELETGGCDAPLLYSFRLSYAAEDRLIFADERVLHGGQGEDAPIARSLGGGQRESVLCSARSMEDPVLFRIAKSLSSIGIYQFHDTSPESRLRGSCDAEDSRVLRSDGGNLAAVLRALRERHGGHYDRIVEVIRLIAPFFSDFALEPMNGDSPRLSLRWRAKGEEYEFGAHQLSDGTLRFMALATLLLQPDERLPSIIVIDEPELGLHPVALGVLANLFQEASIKTRMLVATQSPDFVSFFEPEDVIVADRRAGASSFRRLQSTELSEWLDEYTLGDLWRKNIILGGPTYE